MRKILIVLIAFTLVFLVIKPVMAATHDIVKIGSEFVLTLIKKDEEQARIYLTSNVTIPEIREETPINRVTGLPSPNENVSVTIAYFDDGESMKGRIAFIWEITFSKDKIKDIRVVYDGSNPFMNESKVIKEYEAKNKTNILPPSKFPFDVTHIGGYVDEDILMLHYRNANSDGLLQIKVEPDNADLETLKGEKDEFYSLKNGTNALYQPNFSPAPQLVFQNEHSRYSISISYETKENVTVDDLLKIANSMFLN